MAASNLLSSQHTITRSSQSLPVNVGRSSAQRRPSVAVAAQAQEQRAPATHAMKLIGALAAAQLAFMPVAVNAQGSGPLIQNKGLDERTEQRGASATIEGSDIGSEDSKEVVNKLKNLLPDIKAKLAKVGEGSAGGYSSSIVKELETVSGEIEGLIKTSEQGGDTSNIKSAASSIEQQVNALKALLGYD